MTSGGHGDMVPMPPVGDEDVVVEVGGVVVAGGTVVVEGEVVVVVVVVFTAGRARTVLKLVVEDVLVPDESSELRFTGAGVYIARGSILIEGLT